jgi:hypothetical protein
MILGPIVLFRATCKNFLFLAVWAPGPIFKFRAYIVDPCDILSLLDLFRDILAQFTIFSRLMLILIADSDPLRKNEFNEYKVKGIQRTFYFSSVYF